MGVVGVTSSLHLLHTYVLCCGFKLLMRPTLVVIILIVSTKTHMSPAKQWFGTCPPPSPPGLYLSPYPSVYRNEFCWLCGSASGQIACSKWPALVIVFQFEQSFWHFSKHLSKDWTLVPLQTRSNRTIFSRGFLFILSIKHCTDSPFSYYSFVYISRCFVVVSEIINRKQFKSGTKQSSRISK